MAKGRVTKKSLREGQTIHNVSYVVNKWEVCSIHIGCFYGDGKHLLDFFLNCGEEYLFYSKSKAKTKMNKLNEGLKK